MRHRKKDAGSQGVQLGLIITPMLDMSFQILAFFIMTYNPSALEGHIPGSLVPPENYAKKSADPSVPPDVETPLSIPEEDLDPSLQEAITIRAKAILKDQETGNRTEGMLGQIFVKSALDTDALLVADTDVSIDVAIKKLQDKLASMVPAGGLDANVAKSKTHLKIAAEGELRQQYIMKLYDAGKKAGYANIHFVPPPVLNTKFK
jgi:biopolymer transport protein ExbD